MILATKRQYMKAISSDIYLVILLGLPLFMLGMCGSACNRVMKRHPEAQASMISFGDTNLTNLWVSVEPFADAVRSEDRLTRLAINGDDMFAILSGKVIDAKLNSGILASTNAVQSFSQAEAEHILSWVAKCNSYNVCGYDIRTLPEYYRVFIRNDVYFLILGDNASIHYRDHFAFQAKQGVTPRGDVFGEITNGIFIATERR